MISPTRKTLTACYSALWRGLRSCTPQIELDEKGYVAKVAENLVERVSLGDFEPNLRSGDGNELAKKLRAAHCSAVLAVNTFAPFKTNPTALRLLADGGFASLLFERKCPHGLKGRKSPNLDALVESSSRVVGVESKCTEHLSRHTARFSSAYNAEIRDNRRETAWFELMQQLIRDRQTFWWLDAAQLVKHAFGLAYTFPDRPTTLLYLFWEPLNPEAFPVFAEHRAEVARFAALMRRACPQFVSISYPELWTLWEMQPQCDWLPAHISRLRGRYAVAA